SSDETGFKVERAPGTTTSFTEVGTVGAGITAFSDAGLTNTTQYSYRVRAYNATGNSDYSATATATTFPPPPAAPSNLSGQITKEGLVHLTWTNNATNADYFLVERAVSGAGKYQQLAKISGTLTSFNDTK